MAHDDGPVLLGLDLGTSGAKAGLIDDRGKVMTTATVEYETRTPRPGWAEQDPEDWWSATVEAIRKVLRAGGVPPERIAGTGVSGQMHGSVFLDGSLEVIRPCILWCDQRTSAQCDWIADTVGSENLAALVGNPPLAGFTAPKILWLRENEPECFARVRKVVLPKDYINLRLTGALATEVSDASGTLLFDVRERRWSTEMAGKLDIGTELLPDVLESGDVTGLITPETAAATGLREGTVVAAGGADNACGAIGMGVVNEGEVAVSIGSSGTVLAPTARPVVEDRMRLHSFCHAVPGTWYLMGVVLSAGLSLRWFRDELGEPEVSEARNRGRDPYELLDATAALAPAGSEGLVFLPYMSGERTPHADPNARGILFGMDLTKKRRHVVRAVMEGVVFGLKDSISLMHEMGVPLESVVAGGGGSRSELWKAMQADIFELPIRTATEPDSALVGAALLGGVAAGVFPSVREACLTSVRCGTAIEPDRSNFEACRRGYRKYRELYPALKPLFETD
ncbi:MAG: xylulokinase [Candidatus Geothermincolia bacterium]